MLPHITDVGITLIIGHFFPKLFNTLCEANIFLIFIPIEKPECMQMESTSWRIFKTKNITDGLFQHRIMPLVF